MRYGLKGWATTVIGRMGLITVRALKGQWGGTRLVRVATTTVFTGRGSTRAKMGRVTKLAALKANYRARDEGPSMILFALMCDPVGYFVSPPVNLNILGWDFGLGFYFPLKYSY